MDQIRFLLTCHLQHDEGWPIFNVRKALKDRGGVIIRRETKRPESWVRASQANAQFQNHAYYLPQMYYNHYPRSYTYPPVSSRDSTRREEFQVAQGSTSAPSVPRTPTLPEPIHFYETDFYPCCWKGRKELKFSDIEGDLPDCKGETLVWYKDWEDWFEDRTNFRKIEYSENHQYGTNGEDQFGVLDVRIPSARKISEYFEQYSKWLAVYNKDGVKCVHYDDRSERFIEEVLLGVGIGNQGQKPYIPKRGMTYDGE
ncbi:hypothetical protein N0V90_006898 [Kalmusia sp. IMI 367209]|nr:hypothetical protein N0V90_006898 [Kalmusia sp. IMI 367209]